ncbi:hypothetical protein GPECTOR_6g672 [Gonium pectorale]|uniref:Ribosome biogenesis protein NOP53 n=1 Tax=Gonium pectorale TaxID=33097 RepID=A0A150GV94_GONPE|nr:hypothetical protein GPECTOR_6g672 [Gonium pectorale]|eukprot:KXZ53755.1 hypothetical protein GPECTOR_6g672 [Gonium pectorale]
MAPPAKSRKGKRAWRKNIDASEVEAFVAEENYQAQRGPAARELKDDQLFFEDTTADAEGAAAVVEGKRPAKRRRDEAAAKPLRSEAIIAEAHKAKPFPMAPPPRKPAAAAKPAAGKGAIVAAGAAGGKGKSGGRKGDGRHPLDLWGDEDLAAAGRAQPAEAGPGSAALAKQGQRQTAAAAEGRAAKKARRVEAAAAAEAAALRSMGPSAPALRKSPPPQRIKAVAVDMPGCSFNPEPEQHQDALAVLVASEMRKELKRELLPTAPPVEVEAEGGRPLTELEALQVEVADSDDEDDGQEGAANGGAAAAAADPNAIALAADGDEDDDGEEEEDKGARGGAGAGGRQKAEKKTKKERNKEAAEAELGAKRRLKAQRRELHSLREVQEQLEEEQREKELRRQRMVSLREERAAVEPPRLGKLKFEPPSVQVLTTDEATGSLRQIKPCAMLAADRFKSLQQRGLLEPRKPQPFKEKRRKVVYEKGARFERAEAASSEVRQLSRNNKKARKAAKAAAAAGGEDDWIWSAVSGFGDLEDGRVVRTGAAGLSEQEYTEITKTKTLKVLDTLLAENPNARFVYVSGNGTDAKSRMMWARVKGETENEIFARMPDRAVMVRPGLVEPVNGIKGQQSLAYRFMYGIAPVLRALRLPVINTEELGRAMVAVAKQGSPKRILENDDLLEIARKAKQQQQPSA